MHQSYSSAIGAMGFLVLAFAALFINRFRLLFVHSEVTASKEQETAPAP
jgi:hypothetical protein